MSLIETGVDIGVSKTTVDCITVVSGMSDKMEVVFRIDTEAPCDRPLSFDEIKKIISNHESLSRRIRWEITDGMKLKTGEISGNVGRGAYATYISSTITFDEVQVSRCDELEKLAFGLGIETFSRNSR